MDLGLIDRFDRHQSVAAITEYGELHLIVRATNVHGVSCRPYARDLQAVPRLLTPEPWQVVVANGLAREGLGKASGMIDRVLDRLDPSPVGRELTLERRNIADGIDRGIAGSQVFVDDNTLIDIEACSGGEFGIWLDSDTDDHEIRGED